MKPDTRILVTYGEDNGKSGSQQGSVRGLVGESPFWVRQFHISITPLYHVIMEKVAVNPSHKVLI